MRGNLSRGIASRASGRGHRRTAPKRDSLLGIDASELADVLARVQGDFEGGFQSTVYLNERRVRELFGQTVGQIAELSDVKTRLTELSGSVHVLGAKHSRTRSVTGKSEMDALARIAVLEHVLERRGRLANLAIEDAQPGKLLWLSDGGKGRIHIDDDDFNYPQYHGPREVLEAVRVEKRRQEKVLALATPDDEPPRRAMTLAWLAFTDTGTYAAIASTEWVEWDNLEIIVHGPNRLGFTGLLERRSEFVTFLTPLWIRLLSMYGGW